tara:strand:- start:80 stop:1777 length:1698 start_codon:yes stop_codon:yes gene_type:complete
MISVSGKNWEEIRVNRRLIEKVKVDYNLNDIQSKLVVSRNFSDEEILSIRNKLNFKNPFFKNKDFLLGCELLKKHIINKKKIMIVGDYDVDGCVSTSLMVNFLKKNNNDVNFYIPDRFEDGYGANKKLLIKLIPKYKPHLIIFLDCGSSSLEAIEYSRNLNIKSLIIDHHNIPHQYPSANVFINPKKELNNSYNYLCSACLTYFFIDLYISLNRLKISFKDNLIYVLLATVADVMPLRKLNRLLALNTLKDFNLNQNFIFKYLSKNLNLKKKIGIEELGYLIAPIFNSAGRLENANQIVELLTTDSINKSIKILNRICTLNTKRKLIENRTFTKLNLNKISNQKGIIFIYEPNISEGIIGILASKISEQFSRPCIVFTNSGKILKGSARSNIGFNIGNYINKALINKILINGGGHNLAAGVSLTRSKLNIFKNFLDHFYLKNNNFISNMFISKISLTTVNKNFINGINLLGPFGYQNIDPIFLIEDIKFNKPFLIKEKFISCYIKSKNKTIKAISFSHINSEISYNIINFKKNVNVLVKIKENRWNNKNSVQLEIIDIIKTTINT